MMEQNLINEQATGFEDEQDKIDSESSSSMSGSIEVNAPPMHRVAYIKMVICVYAPPL